MFIYCLTFVKDMATIGRASAKVEAWAAGIRRMLESLIQSNSSLVTDCIREQIESGQDGNGKSLSPTYLNDPYFDKFGNKAHIMAERYRDWKLRITPPEQGGLLGLPPRDADVPNLRINGYYQDSISAVKKSGGVSIGSTAVFQSEIANKYGGDIYKMGDEARKYFKENITEPALKDFLK